MKMAGVLMVTSMWRVIQIGTAFIIKVTVEESREHGMILRNKNLS